jgi:outer membrane protein assembly factor BamA
VTHFNVASLVPDTTDLVHILRHRAAGMGLTGAYPVTSRMQVGLGAQFERLSLSEEKAAGGAQDGVQGRTELSPAFLWDSTHGTGPAMRGTRIALAHTWAGTTLLRSIDSTAQSFRFSQSLGDPFSKGRNAIGFHFQAALTRPSGNVPLTLDRRLYPGDEVVRGFPRGGLTPWAGALGAVPSARPAGADTVLGFSAEYRVPLQGPLSAGAFVDLGWSGISPRNVDLGTGVDLIEKTNRILRASVGGEIRLQLPILHQPGRLIFSWNPLRLNSLIQGVSSPLRLADPRGSIRFALGDRF